MTESKFPIATEFHLFIRIKEIRLIVRLFSSLIFRKDYVASYQMLTVPQDMSGKLFFQVELKDGRKFAHTPGNGEGILESGHQYTYNVVSRKTGTRGGSREEFSVMGW